MTRREFAESLRYWTEIVLQFATVVAIFAALGAFLWLGGIR